jgi:hypothetical protein
MNVTASDVILLSHAAFGILGTLAALYVFVEALNARAENLARIRRGAAAVAVSMCTACVLGGIWYLRFYPAEKALILKGPWPMAHNLFMETKEHLFFAILILALFLPIATAESLHDKAAARRMVLVVALALVFTGMLVEGAGAAIDHGAKVALLRAHP